MGWETYTDSEGYEYYYNAARTSLRRAAQSWNGFSLPRMLLPRMNSLQETGVSTYEPPDGGASPAEDTDWNANPIAKAHGTASVGSNECGNISMNANPMMFKGKGKSGSVGAKPKRDVQPVMILRDRLDALLFTAMAWIFIPAYCFAITVTGWATWSTSIARARAKSAATPARR